MRRDQVRVRADARRRTEDAPRGASGWASRSESRFRRRCSRRTRFRRSSPAGADDYVSLIVDEMIPAVAREKLAEAVDVFCESIAFTPAQCDRIFAAANAHGLAVKGHVEQLSNSHGAELVARHGGWSADHLEYLDDAGVAAMANAGTVAVLLPGAFYFLREKQKPPVEQLRAAGVPMAVAHRPEPRHIAVRVAAAGDEHGVRAVRSHAGRGACRRDSRGGEGARARRPARHARTPARRPTSSCGTWQHPAEIVVNSVSIRSRERVIRGQVDARTRHERLDRPRRCGRGPGALALAPDGEAAGRRVTARESRLIGFACDEGVRRNGGRVGAKDGPRAIRAALANLAWHQDVPGVRCRRRRLHDGDLEARRSGSPNAVRIASRPAPAARPRRRARDRVGVVRGLVTPQPNPALDRRHQHRRPPRPARGRPAQLRHAVLPDRRDGAGERPAVPLSRARESPSRANTAALFDRPPFRSSVASRYRPLDEPAGRDRSRFVTDFSRRTAT